MRFAADQKINAQISGLRRHGVALHSTADYCYSTAPAAWRSGAVAAGAVATEQ